MELAANKKGFELLKVFLGRPDGSRLELNLFRTIAMGSAYRGAAPVIEDTLVRLNFRGRLSYLSRSDFSQIALDKLLMFLYSLSN